ncbi:MAG TPA: hypothetical protein VHO03_14285 [Ignavibacteriales bacterium]|nr:hypothetical protein [Ignavibacteriales bacterium]
MQLKDGLIRMNLTEPRNSGIRGLPPGFNLEMSLRRILEKNPVKMTSELDEQGEIHSC